VDLEFSDEQRAILDAIQSITQRHDTVPLTGSVVKPVEYHYGDALDRDIAEGGFFELALTPGCGAVEAMTLIYEIGKSPTVVEAAASALIGPVLTGQSLPRPIAVARIEDLTRMVRFLDRAQTLIVDLGDDVAILPTAGLSIEPVESMFAYPLGRLTALPDFSTAQLLGADKVPLLRRLWRLALAAEAASAMQAAVDFTTTYVKDRKVFGRPVGTFQTVQHRLAEDVQKCRGAYWLALKAAWSETDEDALLAATYVQEAITAINYDTHQFNGALGMTLEHYLHFWTFRLRLLQGELGGARAQKAALAEIVWGGGAQRAVARQRDAGEVGLDFAWTSSDDAYRAELTSLIEAELPENWWRDYAYDGPAGPPLMANARAFNKKLAERDLVVRHWPEAYGGQDASAWKQIIVSEEMWANGEPRSSLYLGSNWAGPAIMKYGTEEQKQRFLRPIAAGELLWCQGFSEPEAGTDLANMKTRAEPVAGGYLINGSKVWTSYAARADIMFLLARVGGHGKGGVSCFILPTNTPGVDIRPIPGVHSRHDFHEVFFSDAHVTSDALLGEEGRGWDIVTTILHYERIGAARYEYSRRTLDHLVDLFQARGLFDDAVIRAECASALGKIEAARLLTYYVIDGRAKDKQPSADTYVARFAMIQADHAVANLASTYFPDLMVENGDGMLRSHFLAGTTSGIAAGAAEVQLNMIAGRYLELPRH
jgi:alkylation response protein AidB-like acyl-CoA dehydrogenase